MDKCSTCSKTLSVQPIAWDMPRSTHGTMEDESDTSQPEPACTNSDVVQHQESHGHMQRSTDLVVQSKKLNGFSTHESAATGVNTSPLGVVLRAPSSFPSKHRHALIASQSQFPVQPDDDADTTRKTDEAAAYQTNSDTTGLEKAPQTSIAASKESETSSILHPLLEPDLERKREHNDNVTEGYDSLCVDACTQTELPPAPSIHSVSGDTEENTGVTSSISRKPVTRGPYLEEEDQFPTEEEVENAHQDAARQGVTDAGHDRGRRADTWCDLHPEQLAVLNKFTDLSFGLSEGVLEIGLRTDDSALQRNITTEFEKLSGDPLPLKFFVDSPATAQHQSGCGITAGPAPESTTGPQQGEAGATPPTSPGMTTVLGKATICATILTTLEPVRRDTDSLDRVFTYVLTCLHMLPSEYYGKGRVYLHNLFECIGSFNGNLCGYRCSADAPVYITQGTTSTLNNVSRGHFAQHKSGYIEQGPISVSSGRGVDSLLVPLSCQRTNILGKISRGFLNKIEYTDDVSKGTSIYIAFGHSQTVVVGKVTRIRWTREINVPEKGSYRYGNLLEYTLDSPYNPVAGDSGSPIFILSGDQPVLLGMHCASTADRYYALYAWDNIEAVIPAGHSREVYIPGSMSEAVLLAANMMMPMLVD